MSVKLAALALLLAGCLGPLLPAPATTEPRGAHEWLCINRRCPEEAQKLGGTVRGVAYVAGTCRCALEDARRLAAYIEVPPHPERRIQR